MDKTLWQSKTFWVNALTIAASVLTAVSGMTDHVPAEYMPWILTALSLVNIGLRLVTSEPVKLLK